MLRQVKEITLNVYHLREDCSSTVGIIMRDVSGGALLKGSCGAGAPIRVDCFEDKCLTHCMISKIQESFFILLENKKVRWHSQQCSGLFLTLNS